MILISTRSPRATSSEAISCKNPVGCFGRMSIVYANAKFKSTYMAVGQNSLAQMEPWYWKRGLKPAVPWWFNFDPYPYCLEPMVTSLPAPEQSGSCAQECLSGFHDHPPHGRFDHGTGDISLADADEAGLPNNLTR